jgi:uncharacterized membrane protein
MCLYVVYYGISIITKRKIIIGISCFDCLFVCLFVCLLQPQQPHICSIHIRSTHDNVQTLNSLTLFSLFLCTTLTHLFIRINNNNNNTNNNNNNTFRCLQSIATAPTTVVFVLKGGEREEGGIGGGRGRW